MYGVFVVGVLSKHCNMPVKMKNHENTNNSFMVVHFSDLVLCPVPFVLFFVQRTDKDDEHKLPVPKQQAQCMMGTLR